MKYINITVYSHWNAHILLPVLYIFTGSSTFNSQFEVKPQLNDLYWWTLVTVTLTTTGITLATVLYNMSTQYFTKSTIAVILCLRLKVYICVQIPKHPLLLEANHSSYTATKACYWCLHFQVYLHLLSRDKMLKQNTTTLTN